MKEKVEIIKQSERDKMLKNIGKVCQSITGTILKDKVCIMYHVKGSAPMR